MHEHLHNINLTFQWFFSSPGVAHKTLKIFLWNKHGRFQSAVSCPRVEPFAPGLGSVCVIVGWRDFVSPHLMATKFVPIVPKERNTQRFYLHRELFHWSSFPEPALTQPLKAIIYVSLGAYSRNHTLFQAQNHEKGLVHSLFLPTERLLFRLGIVRKQICGDSPTRLCTTLSIIDCALLCASHNSLLRKWLQRAAHTENHVWLLRPTWMCQKY